MHCKIGKSHGHMPITHSYYIVPLVRRNALRGTMLLEEHYIYHGHQMVKLAGVGKANPYLQCIINLIKVISVSLKCLL